MGKSWALQVAVVGLVIACLGSANKAESEDKVLIEFYSESLCPYCSNFVVNYLSKMFTNGMIDLVNLRMIPYGNARIYSDGGDIVCQHGQDECDLNVIQSCAIKLYPNVTQWFPFILCLETLVWELPRSSVLPNWKRCVAPPTGLDLERINNCFQGPLGDKIERAYGAETDSLDPPHKYVPWVVVNGTPLYDDYEDIEAIVCEAYKGPISKPDVCGNVHRAMEHFKAGVCEVEELEIADASQTGHAGL